MKKGPEGEENSTKKKVTVTEPSGSVYQTKDNTAIEIDPESKSENGERNQLAPEGVDRRGEGGFIIGHRGSKVGPNPAPLKRSYSFDKTASDEEKIDPNQRPPQQIKPKKESKNDKKSKEKSPPPEPIKNKVNGAVGSASTNASTHGSKEATLVRNELITAVESNNLDRARRVLGKGVDPNSVCDEKGCFPLHIACKFGYSSMVKLLLDHGAQKDQPDTALDRSPLHFAAVTNFPETVQILLTYGVDLQARNKYGANALHVAAGAGQAIICKILATAGCNVNAIDLRKMTPLMCAAKFNDLRCIEILLDFGAKILMVDDKGKHVLIHAAEPWEGIEVKSNRMVSVFRRLVQAGVPINLVDNDGKSALFYAIQMGSSEAISTLYDLGAELLDAVSTLGLAKKFPSLMRQFLNKSVTSNLATCDPESKNFYIQFDYTCLTFCPKDVQDDKLKTMQNREETEGVLPELGVLHGLTSCNDKQILSHPICESLLRLKWKKVKWYLYLDMLLFAVFLAFLTAVIFMEYESDTYEELIGNATDIYSTTEAPSSGIELMRPQFPTIPKIPNDEEVPKETEHQRTMYCLDGARNIAVWTILWILTACLAIRELIQLIQSPLHYIVQMENMLELTLVFSVALLSLAECGVSSFVNARDHFAAFCLIVGWTIQVTLYGKIPVFGKYIRMFAAVAIDIIKCLFTYLGLLFAFSLTLHFLFKTHPGFDSVGFTFLKTFAMMIGEIDLIRTFVDHDKNSLVVPFTSHFIFLLFIVFISIVLTSLLVAIAVSDILVIQKEGEYMSLVQQINVAGQLEDALQQRSLLYPQFGMRDLRSLRQRKGVIFPNLKDHGKLSKEALEIVITQHSKKVDRSSSYLTEIPTDDKESRGKEVISREDLRQDDRMTPNSRIGVGPELADELLGKMRSKFEMLALDDENRHENLIREMREMQSDSVEHLNREMVLLKGQLDEMAACLREICKSHQKGIHSTDTGSTTSTSETPTDMLSRKELRKKPSRESTHDDLEDMDLPLSPARSPPLAPPPQPLPKESSKLLHPSSQKEDSKKKK